MSGTNWIFGNGINAEKFKKNYRMLLEEILELLPDTKNLLLEPFDMEGSATRAYFDTFTPEVAARANAVRALA